jgi:membrane protein YdbS with pleckstrin-like domain
VDNQRRDEKIGKRRTRKIEKFNKIKQRSVKICSNNNLVANMEKSYSQKGLEKYSLLSVIGQNLFLVVYFGIAFVGMYPLQIKSFPIVSIIFIIFIIFISVMLIFVLRKHLCTNCFYYGKICGTGWGKLAACLFRKNSGNYELGGKLASITWILAMFFPLIGMIFALIFNWFSITIALLLMIFIILSGMNFFIHKKTCERCKMRFICPGSVAR